MTYDFDTVIDRRGTGAMKVDGLRSEFGRDDLQGMWIADMDFAVAPEITAALQHRIAHPVYGYDAAPQSYWDSISSWLQRRHHWQVCRHELAFIPGVVRGLGCAVNYFSSPGDGIVIQPPVYHPFRMVVEGNGRRLLTNPLLLSNGNYSMDLEGLERIFALERPSMMILCNPHNPIGLQWDRDTLCTLASLARQYGVTVVSDEIHGDLMLDSRPHHPFAAVSDDAAAVGVTFGAPSKTFNIAGMVSSWCVVKNPDIRRGFYAWLEANHFSEPVMMAVHAAEAAYTYGEPWLDQMLHYISGNLDTLETMLAQHLPQVRMIRPQASFLVWLDCRGLDMTHDELIDLFVNHAHLALNDGAMFGPQGSGFMRFNVGCPRSALRSSVMALASALTGAEASALQ